jgi:plastocyanin
MKRFVSLLAATAAVVAVPLAIAESTVSISTQTTINGETRTWNYHSTDANHSAASFNFSMPAIVMPPMPAMPDMPSLMPHVPSPAVLARSMMSMPHMPNMEHLHMMLAQAKTRFQKVRACREAYLSNPPFNAQMRKDFRLCIRSAMGIPSGSAGSQMSSPATSSSSRSSSSAASAQTVQATISGFAFSPAVLNVKKGTTVVWTNLDDVGHTVTGNSGGPDSALFGKNQTYSYTFNTVGSFPYYCQPHPSMTGVVTVTN